MGLYSLVSPSPRLTSQIALPTPRAPARHVRRSLGRSGYRWEGIIIARSWSDGFTDDDYRLMAVGGKRLRLAHPDAMSADGIPIFWLTDAERRARERLLNRADTIYETHNVACNTGRTVMLNFVSAAGGYTGVNYFAVGTGAGVVPAATDTQLGLEYFRKQVTITTISGNQIDLSTSFATGDANTTYTEAGIFGNGATGAANSGSLFAHATYNYTKSSSSTLTNDYYVFFS